MKIGPFGPLEIVIILVVILVLFGPKNLPKLGTAVGKAVKNLREGMGGSKKAEEKAEAEPVKAEAEKVEAKAEEIEVEVVDKPAPSAKPAPKSQQTEELEEA